jgi:hypothetical protein
VSSQFWMNYNFCSLIKKVREKMSLWFLAHWLTEIERIILQVTLVKLDFEKKTLKIQNEKEYLLISENILINYWLKFILLI